MIRNSEMRQYEFNNFPEVPQVIWDEIERDCLQQYLFYKKTGKNSAEIYCTSCRQSETVYYDRTINGIPFSGDPFFKKLEHNVAEFCPMCDKDVTIKNLNRGHKLLKSRGNYLIFLAKDDKLYAEAVKYEVEWENHLDPRRYIYHFRRYAFIPGAAQAWRYRAEPYDGKRGWVPMRVVNEPIFNLSGGWPQCTEDARMYTCINEQAIQETFLRYQEYEWYVNHAYRVFVIKFLEAAAKHPALCEQLCKCGFGFVLDDMFGSNFYKVGLSVDWKADNIKKALGFSAPEMDFFYKNKGHIGAYEYNQYKKCKEDTGDYKAAIKIIEEYGFSHACEICDLSKRYGISTKKAVNYLAKQGEKTGYSRQRCLGTWKDCLEMMRQLEYPDDSSLRFPKDLESLHTRLINEDTRKKSEAERGKTAALNKKIKRQEKKLCKFIYANSDYTVVLPESVEDIRREGRILDICVGSYAERHAEGVLHILFIRPHEDTATPFFVMEVTTSGTIRQCHGYRNERENEKPESILRFEREYALFLDCLYKRISPTEYGEKLSEIAAEYDKAAV